MRWEGKCFINNLIECPICFLPACFEMWVLLVGVGIQQTNGWRWNWHKGKSGAIFCGTKMASYFLSTFNTSGFVPSCSTLSLWKGCWLFLVRWNEHSFVRSSQPVSKWTSWHRCFNSRNESVFSTLQSARLPFWHHQNRQTPINSTSCKQNRLDSFTQNGHITTA